MGGGGQIDPIEGNAIVMMGPIPTQRFVMVAEMSEPGGDLLAYATCLGEAKVGLK